MAEAFDRRYFCVLTIEVAEDGDVVKQTAWAMEEIASASQEQSADLGQINSANNQMKQKTSMILALATQNLNDFDLSLYFESATWKPIYE
nr:hypothetical protein [uncultured Undibacterium sp.]